MGARASVIIPAFNLAPYLPAAIDSALTQEPPGGAAEVLVVGEGPTDGRVLGRLLAGNFVSGGASTFRSSLLPAILPIAPEAAYPDWWIAACIAAVAEITHDNLSSNRYRYHGANMGLGSGPQHQ